MAGPETHTALISAFSKRQVMDWSLVLASQDIPAIIVQSSPTGWALQVEPADYARAIDAIRLYRLENRRWAWRQPVPWIHTTFHFGSLGWCLLLVLVHWWTFGQTSGFRANGQFASEQVAQGQWWRAFTAILLHQDLSHLLSNVTIGFVLFGLSMARYGAGLGLFAAYLCGAAGNLLGYLLHPKPYSGLGASGMILGALGLVAIPPLHSWPPHPRALKEVLQAAFASIMLFVILGVNPASDVIAHAGGFASGITLGVVLSSLPNRLLQSRALAAGTWLVFGALFAATNWLAWRAGP